LSTKFSADRSKDFLDIFIDSSAEEYRVADRADDISALVERMRVAAAAYVVKASGDFEAGLVTALATAGLPVCRFSPQRVRSFARALGESAKTDWRATGATAARASLSQRYAAPDDRRKP
jgi:transposase